jgi:hypothetical protein
LTLIKILLNQELCREVRFRRGSVNTKLEKLLILKPNAVTDLYSHELSIAVIIGINKQFYFGWDMDFLNPAIQCRFREDQEKLANRGSAKMSAPIAAVAR